MRTPSLNNDLYTTQKGSEIMMRQVYEESKGLSREIELPKTTDE